MTLAVFIRLLGYVTAVVCVFVSPWPINFIALLAVLAFIGADGARVRAWL